MFKITLKKDGDVAYEFNVVRSGAATGITSGTGCSEGYLYLSDMVHMTSNGSRSIIRYEFSKLYKVVEFDSESDFKRAEDLFINHVRWVTASDKRLNILTRPSAVRMHGVTSYLKEITDVALIIVNRLRHNQLRCNRDKATLAAMGSFTNPHVELSTYEVTATVKAESAEAAKNMIFATDFKIEKTN